jgi:hypothetical protein
MMGVVMIFGPPLVVAATMLSPQGLNFVVNGMVRYAGLVLLLSPFAAWPIFLAQAVAPPPGQGRLRAIVGLWLGGAVLVSAVMSLLAGMLGYSAHPLNFDPSGHELIPYTPHGGFLLADSRSACCWRPVFGEWPRESCLSGMCFKGRS